MSPPPCIIKSTPFYRPIAHFQLGGGSSLLPREGYLDCGRSSSPFWLKVILAIGATVDVFLLPPLAYIKRNTPATLNKKARGRGPAAS